MDHKKTWFVCPICSKKLLKISIGAESSGIYIKCRNCKSEIEIKIKSPTEAIKKM